MLNGFIEDFRRKSSLPGKQNSEGGAEGVTENVDPPSGSTGGKEQREAVSSRKGIKENESDENMEVEDLMGRF